MCVQIPSDAWETVFESVDRLREQIDRRLAEIDSELADYETLAEERRLLLETLSRPPFSDGEQPTRPRARAPRGENIKRVLGFLAEHPDATAAEIAEATEIRRPVVHNTVRALVSMGRIVRVTTPGGVHGYHISDSEQSRAERPLSRRR